MNAEQKQRAAELISSWNAQYPEYVGDRMAALLQELVDMPAPCVPDKASCLSTGGMTVWDDSVSIEKCNNFVHLASQAAGFKDELINTRAELADRAQEAEPVGYLYTNVQSGEYHVSDYDDDYRGPERVMWYIEPVYRRTKGQQT